MPVTDVHKDTDALTMTIAARFEAPVERVWLVWADPRQLERWWGPPTHPATVVEHAISPGGTVAYFMTSPEGERYHGWWRVLEAEPSRRLRFEDGFADADGNPVDSMPTTVTTVTLEPSEGATAMRIQTLFPSREEMDKLVEMGIEAGITAALGQIDEIL